MDKWSHAKEFGSGYHLNTTAVFKERGVSTFFPICLFRTAEICVSYVITWHTGAAEALFFQMCGQHTHDG